MKNIGSLIFLLFLAIFFGLACAVLPWFLSIGLGLLACVLVLFGRFALLDMAVFLLLVLGVVPISGRSKVDFLAVVMVMFMLAKNARQIKPVMEQHKLVLSWVAGIVAWGVFALAYGVLYRHNNLTLAYSDARFLIYWMVLPLTLVLLQERLTVRKIVLLLAVMGAVLGFIGLLQSLLHRPLLLSDSGRVEALQNTLTTYDDVTRSIVPGTIVVSFALYFSWARLLSSEKVSKWWWLVLALAVGGILVNFGRTLWLASLTISLFMAVRSQGGKSLRMVSGLLCLGILGGMAIYIAKPVMIESIVDRVASSSEEGRSSTSWSWRQFENRFAIASIKNRPLFGIGLGGEYKPFEPAFRAFEEQTGYIHNAYLFMPMKFGILGALFIVGVLFWLAVRFNRRLPEGRGSPFERDALTACGAILIQVMGLSFIEPEFNSFVGTMSMALLIGIAERVRTLGSTQGTPVGQKGAIERKANLYPPRFIASKVRS